MNRESHVCFGTFIPLFIQLYSTSKFKIKSKSCSVSNHLSNKMLYLKIIGDRIDAALLVGLLQHAFRLLCERTVYRLELARAGSITALCLWLSQVRMPDTRSAVKDPVPFDRPFLAPLEWCLSLLLFLSATRDSGELLWCRFSCTGVGSGFSFLSLLTVAPLPRTLSSLPARCGLSVVFSRFLPAKFSPCMYGKSSGRVQKPRARDKKREALWLSLSKLP